MDACNAGAAECEACYPTSTCLTATYKKATADKAAADKAAADKKSADKKAADLPDDALNAGGAVGPATALLAGAVLVAMTGAWVL